MKAPVLIVAACGLLLAVPAFAQTESYETPGYAPATTPAYTPVAPAVLDPSYGLPTFGMPGAELPQQRTLATEAALAKAAAVPDDGRQPVDFTPPKAQGATSDGSLASETPLYTTPDTGTTGDDMTPDDAAR